MYNSKKRYKAVFIDLDDTIWDFQKSASESFHEGFEVFMLHRYFDSVEHFLSLYSPRNKELWGLYDKNAITKEYLHKERFRYPFVAVGYTETQLPDEIGHFFLHNTSKKANLLPYAKELLEYLQPRYPLTIVSNGFVEVQYSKLKNTNLTNYFSHIVLSEEVGAQKPHPAIFAHALALNEVCAAEAIMIGDNYKADILGAAESRIDQIYYAAHTQEGLKATYTVKHLSEITDIL